MKFHIHTPPGCCILAHDPGCPALGVEINCMKIETGKNKGNYVCVHLDPDEQRELELALGYQKKETRSKKAVIKK